MMMMKDQTPAEGTVTTTPAIITAPRSESPSFKISHPRRTLTEKRWLTKKLLGFLSRIHIQGVSKKLFDVLLNTKK